LAILARETKARRFAAGESIVSEGEGADSLFLLTQGSVDVCVSTGETAARHRLAVIDAGNVFGELALFGLARSADVVAQGDVEVQVLSKRSLAVLKESHPAIYARLLESVGRSLAQRLQHANNEIRALA
jgi:CRP-like cAMP-binding protein